VFIELPETQRVHDNPEDSCYVDSEGTLNTSDSQTNLYRPSLDLDSLDHIDAIHKVDINNNVGGGGGDNGYERGRSNSISGGNQLAAEFNYRSTGLSVALSMDKNREDVAELSIAPNKVVDETQSGELKEEMKIDFHVISLSDLEKRTESNIHSGLTSEQARQRLARDGANTIRQTNYLSKIFKFLMYFFGGFSLILWPAAIACVLAYQPFGKPVPDPASLGLAIVIFAVIFINAFFNAYQDYQSLKVMSAIGKMLPQTAIVIRNGSSTEIPLKDIVVGDVVVLGNGNKVPADCRVIDTQQLKMDKSMLTGESEPISCTVDHTDVNYMETKNLLFMGSNIVEGSGSAIVVATGNRTVMGKIYRLSGGTRTASTPINREINIFLLIIVAFAFCVCLAIALAYGLWLKKKYPSFMSVSGVIVVIIGAVVGLLPDGLPVSITLTFSLIARKMFQHNVMVKNLPTVETLGSISVIASDKTGTLTQNKMSVMNIFLSASRRYQIGEEMRRLYDVNLSFMELLKTSCLCNRAVFDETTAHLPLQQRKVVGDASDTALLLFSEDLVRTNDVRGRYEKLVEIPFNSKNKWMLSIYAEPSNSRHAGQVCLMMKGAPEMILDRCTTILMEDGAEVELTQEMRENIAQEQEALSEKGERVFGLSCTYLSESIYPPTYHFDVEARNFPMENLCFVGLASLIDPPKVDVPDAIKQCQTAGIRVMMVTGDHPTTAVSIARMVGIVTNEHVDAITSDECMQDIVARFGSKKEKKEYLRTQSAVVKGVDIPNFSKETWYFLLNYKELVFARTTPEHKLKIVKECQRLKHVVAAIGDGVNDSPALKQSNVGVAMGSGSDIAREAADIVLTDSSFSSIVTGVRLGRVAFDNLKKVLVYMLPAGSFSELIPVLGNIFFGLPTPLSSFLMVVICAGTDVFPSLALIYEEGERDIMKKKPRSVTRETLVNIQLLIHTYLFLGVLECTSAFGMWFYYMSSFGGFKIRDLFFAFDKYTAGFYGKTQHQLDELKFTGQCVFFVTLVMVQITGNLISTRTRELSFFQQLPFRGRTKNMNLFVFSFLSVCVAFVCVYLPLINRIFSTRPVPFQFWLIPIGCGLVIFCLDEFRKVIVRLLPVRIARRLFW